MEQCENSRRAQKNTESLMQQTGARASVRQRMVQPQSALRRPQVSLASLATAQASKERAQRASIVENREIRRVSRSGGRLRGRRFRRCDSRAASWQSCGNQCPHVDRSPNSSPSAFDSFFFYGVRGGCFDFFRLVFCDVRFCVFVFFVFFGVCACFGFLGFEDFFLGTTGTASGKFSSPDVYVARTAALARGRRVLRLGATT